MKNLTIIALLLTGTLLEMSGCSAPTYSNRESSDVTGQSTNILDVGDNGGNIPEDTENPDFRNVCWGMSKKDVEAHEELELCEDAVDSDMLCATTKVQGYPMTLVYSFNSHNELCAAYYLLSETYSSPNRYITSYENLSSALTGKYGEPISTEDIWVDDLFKDSPNDYGLAVARGDYVRRATWDNEETNIQLCLTGKNYDVVLGIKYSSEQFIENEVDFNL